MKAYVVNSIYGHTASRDLRTHDKGRTKRDKNQSIGPAKEKGTEKMQKPRTEGSALGPSRRGRTMGEVHWHL